MSFLSLKYGISANIVPHFCTSLLYLAIEMYHIYLKVRYIIGHLTTDCIISVEKDVISVILGASLGA